MMRSWREVLKEYMSDQWVRKNRLVTKDGHCNIEFGKVSEKGHLAYTLDLWTTLLETRWRYILVYFSASFSCSWLIFGLICYWIARNHGDLPWQNPPANHTVCLFNVTDITYAYLYALETQTGLGYGNMVLTDECPVAVLLMTVQMLTGIFINCFWCGVVMSKIALPKKRAKTIMFSESAVICPKKGTLCLQIRVANLRKSLMLGSKFYGKLFRTNPEGEIIILDQVNIDFMLDAGTDNLFFVCPLTLYHFIDKNSPFFDMAVDNMHQQAFELVVFFDSTSESTSSTFQVRTSYIPQEIMWGHDFLPIISRSKEGKHRVDFSNFSRVEPVPTAHCAYCYHNEVGHHHHSIHGIDNQSFAAIDNDPPKSIKM